MYKVNDYLRNGLIFVNNMVRPHHKVLSQLMLYATTKCRSRCKHCAIWKKKEEYLSLNDIKSIMNSKCVTSATTVGLEGGEFLLHPEADSIMEWFAENHPQLHPAQQLSFPFESDRCGQKISSLTFVCLFGWRQGDV